MAIDQSGDDMRRSSPSQRLYDRCASTPDESVEFAEVRGYVRDALDKLPDRHRIVAIGYYLRAARSRSSPSCCRSHRRGCPSCAPKR
jgi:hypothetical protein